jgi:hypothetical protein
MDHPPQRDSCHGMCKYCSEMFGVNMSQPPIQKKTRQKQCEHVHPRPNRQCMDMHGFGIYRELFIYIRWFAVIYHWLTRLYTSIRLYTPCTSLHILGDHELPGMRGAASKFVRLSLDHFHRANRVRKIGQEEMRRPQANHSKSKQIQANLGIKWRQAMQHCSKLIQSVEHFANVTSMHRKSAT